MKQVVFALLLCLGVTSVVSAQQPELSEVFVSPEQRITFRYPATWTTDTSSDLFIATSDGDIRIEFYLQSVAAMILDLGAEPNQTLDIFQDIMAVDVAAASGDVISMRRPVASLNAMQDFARANALAGLPLVINGSPVVGRFSVAGAGGMYIFVVRGGLFEAPGLTFVRVTGTASRLISERDLIVAIINSFGSFVSPDEFAPAPIVASPTPIPPTPIPTATSTPQPCTVRATGEGETSLHVGPGNNRTIIRFLAANRDFEVIGTADARDGSQWWRLDKEEAAGSQAIQVIETWVAAAEVIESGDCERVGTVAPPPIVPLPQPTAVPTPTGAPSGPSGPNQPTISFIADRTEIMMGECDNLIWDVQNAREVRWQDEPYAPEALFTVCPPETTTYTLEVVPFEGPVIRPTVTVFVGEGAPEGPPPTEEVSPCVPDQLPQTRTGNIATGGSDTFGFTLDPCLSPTAIVIEMTATSRGLDPFLRATISFEDGSSMSYSNDDSGESLDSRIVIPSQAGSTRLVVTASSFGNNSGGSYRITIRRVTPS